MDEIKKAFTDKNIMKIRQYLEDDFENVIDELYKDNFDLSDIVLCVVLCYRNLGYVKIGECNDYKDDEDYEMDMMMNIEKQLSEGRFRTTILMFALISNVSSETINKIIEMNGYDKDLKNVSTYDYCPSENAKLNEFEIAIIYYKKINDIYSFFIESNYELDKNNIYNENFNYHGITHWYGNIKLIEILFISCLNIDNLLHLINKIFNDKYEYVDTLYNIKSLVYEEFYSESDDRINLLDDIILEVLLEDKADLIKSNDEYFALNLFIHAVKNKVPIDIIKKLIKNIKKDFLYDELCDDVYTARMCILDSIEKCNDEEIEYYVDILNCIYEHWRKSCF